MDRVVRDRILALRDRVVTVFNERNWQDVGNLTGRWQQISQHPHLLRSLPWGDQEYSDAALEIIERIALEDSRSFLSFETYVSENFQRAGQGISFAWRATRAIVSSVLFLIGGLLLLASFSVGEHGVAFTLLPSLVFLAAGAGLATSRDKVGIGIGTGIGIVLVVLISLVLVVFLLIVSMALSRG